MKTLNSADIAQVAYNAEPVSQLLELSQYGELSLIVDAAVEMMRDEWDNAVDLSEFKPLEAIQELKALLRTEVADTHFATYRLN